MIRGNVILKVKVYAHMHADKNDHKFISFQKTWIYSEVNMFS